MPYMSKNEYRGNTTGDGGGDAVVDRRQHLEENASGNSVVVPGGTGTLPANPALIDVMLNGVEMTHGVGKDWTYSGNTITFSFSLNSDRVLVKFFNAA